MRTRSVASRKYPILLLSALGLMVLAGLFLNSHQASGTLTALTLDAAGATRQPTPPLSSATSAALARSISNREPLSWRDPAFTGTISGLWSGFERLYWADRRGELSAAARQFGVTLDADRVEASIVPKLRQGPAAAAAAAALGARVVGVSPHFVEAWVPVSALADLAVDPAVLRINPLIRTEPAITPNYTPQPLVSPTP